ncbi:MAG TPA: DUF1800 domain-containing protein [Ktedonobacteraceae bacterium]|nr:DUF1800 domain-containing protein [Ktedonobacteraceae bacterium]
MDTQDQPTEPIGPQDPEDTQPRLAAVKTAPPPPKKPQISRRVFLGASALGIVGVTGGSIALAEMWQHGDLSVFGKGPVASASAMQTGHLLRRAGFGATPDELASYQSLGFAGAVDQLLNYQQVSDSDLENRLQQMNFDLSKPQEQQRWWLMRMAWSKRPLLEKMTLFWHGVLTSSFRKVGGPANYGRMINQNQFLRTHAFDTFDTILLGITSDPAMLFYLDLTKSTSCAPNENYARELMELFTLGIGHYTQQDVAEGAAALTGWRAYGLTSRYIERNHNNLTKTFLGQRGNFDYKDVVRILTNHPAAPWFICRKLFTFFVYENPTNDDLKPLVDSYVQSGHNMGAVMRTLLLSPQFSSPKAYRARVKSPTEFVAGAFRALNRPGDGLGLPALTTQMGQALLDPPNVAGWPGDKVSALWLNSGTWMTRLNFIDRLLVAGTPGQQKRVMPVDFQQIVNDQKLDSPESFVDHFSSFLLDGVVTADRRTQLLEYFTSPAQSRGGATVSLTNGKAYPLSRIRGTVYLIMGSPEYQLN